VEVLGAASAQRRRGTVRSMDELGRVRKDWERWGEADPLFAVYTKEGTESGGWNPEDFLRSGAQLVDALLSELARRDIRVEMGRALDFGCGAGRLTQALAAHFDEAHGVDISGPMVDEARRLASGRAGNVTFHVNTAPDLSLFPAAHFDFVLSYIVLQHMPAPLALAYVSEMLRVLRPGGIAVFQLPERHGPPQGMFDQRRLPPSVRNRLAQVKARVTRRPTMEMHPVSAYDVARTVEASGACIRAVWPDDHAGALCLSLTYVVAAEGATSSSG
jgi:SAM-dependent methyltransferase